MSFHKRTVPVDDAEIVDSETEVKTDSLFDSASDSLCLGFYRESDDGESSFYNSSDFWKWGIPPTSGENSWVILT